MPQLGITSVSTLGDSSGAARSDLVQLDNFPHGILSSIAERAPGVPFHSRVPANTDLHECVEYLAVAQTGDSSWTYGGGRVFILNDRLKISRNSMQFSHRRLPGRTGAYGSAPAARLQHRHALVKIPCQYCPYSPALGAEVRPLDGIQLGTS